MDFKYIKHSYNMNENSQVLKIHFDMGVNSLYELGYLSIDIYQLIVFCNLIEENNYFELERNFFSPRNPYALSRNNPLFSLKREKAKIQHLQDGSVDIVIAAVGVVAAIIMPLVALNVQEKLNRSRERYTFNISAEDDYLNKLLDKFKEGYFGYSEEGLNNIFRILRNGGYSIEANANNVYTICKVLNKYEQRIVKLINKKG